AIHQHAAGPATGAIAAPVGARQAQFHRNHFPQGGARFVFGEIRLAVDEERCLFVRERLRKRRKSRGSSEQRFPCHGGEHDTRSGGFQKISARITHFDPPAPGKTFGRYCLWHVVQEASTAPASAASALPSLACAAL